MNRVRREMERAVALRRLMFMNRFLLKGISGFKGVISCGWLARFGVVGSILSKFQFAQVEKSRASQPAPPPLTNIFT
jgi:hypothetical protein